MSTSSWPNSICWGYFNLGMRKFEVFFYSLPKYIFFFFARRKWHIIHKANEHQGHHSLSIASNFQPTISTRNRVPFRKWRKLSWQHLRRNFGRTLTCKKKTCTVPQLHVDSVCGYRPSLTYSPPSPNFIWCSKPRHHKHWRPLISFGRQSTTQYDLGAPKTDGGLRIWWVKQATLRLGEIVDTCYI